MTPADRTASPSPWLPIDDDAKRGQSVLLGWYAPIGGLQGYRTIGWWGSRGFYGLDSAPFRPQPDVYMPLPDPPVRSETE